MVALLAVPLVKNSSGFNAGYFAMCMSLFVLAVFVGALEIFRDLYTFIPYDLYDVGLTVVI